MSLTETVVDGTLHPDGTLDLDQKPKLAPGRVTVILRQREQAPAAPHENWFQCLQRIRARREAEGYAFMDEQETAAHIEQLREGDRIDELIRGIGPRGPAPGNP